jgi:hypothetical protein
MPAQHGVGAGFGQGVPQFMDAAALAHGHAPPLGGFGQAPGSFGQGFRQAPLQAPQQQQQSFMGDFSQLNLSASAGAMRPAVCASCAVRQGSLASVPNLAVVTSGKMLG